MLILIIIISSIIFGILTEYVSVYLLNNREELDIKRNINKKTIIILILIYFIVLFGIYKENLSYYYIIISLTIGISVMTDIREHLILNKVTYPFFIITTIYLLINNEWKTIIIGIFFMMLFLFLLLLVPNGLGMGDIKLFIPLFMFLGVPESFLYLFLCSLIGVIHHSYVIYKEGKKRSVPFGPSIGISYILYIYIGTYLNELLISNIFL